MDEEFLLFILGLLTGMITIIIFWKFLDPELILIFHYL